MKHGGTVWCQISGFRRSEIYPLNPNALDCGANSSSNANISCLTASNSTVMCVRSDKFTSEQIKLFQRVNNYDIPVPEYS